jgi:membrane protease YdiL (CAAX protease family)
VGEEAFFRGFVNNDLSNRYGDNAGLATSSVIFGLAHSGQGQTAKALQATAVGFYFSWRHQKNGFAAGAPSSYIFSYRFRCESQ